MVVELHGGARGLIGRLCGFLTSIRIAFRNACELAILQSRSKDGQK
jgi:hypothetical protein